jgi:hypothetical protein
LAAARLDPDRVSQPQAVKGFSAKEKQRGAAGVGIGQAPCKGMEARHPFL